MIIGIGIDLVDVARLEQVLERHGSRFASRIFTDSEISYCEAHNRRSERYASRFAAKEAARKAFGAATSIVGLAWRDLEIISSTEGAPHLELHGRAGTLARQLGITRVHVSLTHANNQAIAEVILEKTE